MNEYCHRREFQIRYTDFDAYDRIRLSTLLSLAQESACSSADELQFGYDDLKPKGLAFITVHTVGELYAPVKIGDTITVETWPLPPRHVIFERDYAMKNQRGERVCDMASRWCLVDLKSFSLLTPDYLGEANEKCPYNPRKIFPSVNWQIKKLDQEKQLVFKTSVGFSRLDHYFHLNNTYYADLFTDCFSLQELDRPIKNFQIAYINQAKEGAELSFFKKTEGESTVCEAWCGAEAISRFFLKFGSRDPEKT